MMMMSPYVFFMVTHICTWIDIRNTTHWYFQRIKKLLQPDYAWGPACPTHRALAGFGKGATFDKNIGKIRGLRNDPSNATLLTNVDSTSYLLTGSSSNNGIFTGEWQDHFIASSQLLTISVRSERCNKSCSTGTTQWSLWRRGRVWWWSQHEDHWKKIRWSYQSFQCIANQQQQE